MVNEVPNPARCILVVDDEPLLRMMLTEAFEDMGAKVIEADSADAAWAIIESGRQIDLVFTDHMMPGSRTGTELITDIQAQFPSIRTALATGFMKGERPADASIFRKPYDVQDAARTLMMMLSRSPSQAA